MATYPTILHRLTDGFESEFNPKESSLDFDKTVTTAEAEISNTNSGINENDNKVKTVLSIVADFLRNISRSNYFSEKKQSLRSA